MSAGELGKWRRTRATMNLLLLGGGPLGAGLSYYFWRRIDGAAVTLGAICCLALGFWVTEMLIGVFTQVKQANGTAVVFVFTGKLLWWAAIFWAARHLPAGLDGAVAMGIGIFLLTLLAATLRHYGMPRISEGNPPGDP